MKRNFAIFTVTLCALATLNVVSAQVKPAPRTSGIDVAGMDRSARPQDDFFRFVNGAWADKTPIPPDRSRWGTFEILRDEADNALKQILEEAEQKNAPRGSEIQKVGDVYRSVMDTAGIEAAGIKPLQPYLARIGEIEQRHAGDAVRPITERVTEAIGGIRPLRRVQQHNLKTVSLQHQDQSAQILPLGITNQLGQIQLTLIGLRHALDQLVIMILAFGRIEKTRCM